MEYYVTQPKDYWIAPNAVNITLNAIGNANRIQGSVVSGAVIMCYVPSIKPASQGGEAENGDGLDYGVDHYPKRWPLSLSPTYFNSDSAKYVYAAIPRSASVGTQAVIVFPSELLDIYGRAERPEDSSDDSSSSGDDDVYYEQIGSTDYFYVFLQGIISSPSDSPLQRQMQHDILFGELDTPQGNENRQNEGFWFTYSSANGEVTFLKRIIMAATSWFTSLRLGNSGNVLSGVAKATTSAEYVNSETLVATPSYISANYLSKKNADTAQGRITFNAGLVSKQDVSADGDVISDNLHSDGYSDDTLAGSGYHVYKDANGNGHVCTDILDVRMKARFAELEIRKLSYINAEQVQSEAASKLEIVLPIAASGTVLNGTFSESNVAAYRCMVLADDGTMATKNGWKLGDQARCQTFNITAPGDYTNIESRLYWRLVVRIGQCMDDGTIITQQTDLTDYTGKIHHFFDLANLADLTCDPTTRTPNEGAEFTEFFSDTLTTGNAYHGMMTQNYNSASADDLAVMATQEWNDVPAADDDVVQMGSQTDETRMGFFVTKADGLNTGPYIYAGVNNFSLVGKMITKITPQEVLISARKLQVFSDPNAGDASPLTHYRGDWTQGSTSYYYDEWDYQGSRWLCLYQGAEGTTEAPGTTPANWKEISLKGDDGTGYKLLPNPNIIKTKQTGENTYDPATASLTCGYVKSVGNNITSVDNATSVIDSKYAVFFRRKARGGSYDSKYYYYVNNNSRSLLSGISLSDYDGVEFYLASKPGVRELITDPITHAASVSSLSGIIDHINVPVVADGENGTSPIVADLDNQMTSVACDSSGNVEGSTEKSLATTVRMYKGSTKQTGAFSSIGCKIGSTSIVSNDYVNGYKASVNTTTGVVTITVEPGTNIDGKTDVDITAVMTIDGAPVTRTVTFTISGVRAGEDGSPATIYELLPSKDAISFGSGTTLQSMYMELLKIEGDSATDLVMNGIENSGLYVIYGTTNIPDEDDAKKLIDNIGSKHSDVQKWGVDNDSQDDTLTFGGANNNTATILSTATFTQIYLALYRKVTANGTTSYVLLDRETVPVVKDGANGHDGQDGTDGIDGVDGEDGLDAWTLTVNPSPIIIEQDIETPSSFGLPINISFIAKCGDNTATVGTIKSGDVSNNLGLTITRETSGTDYNNGVRLKITAYNKNSQTGKYVTNGYIDCTVPLSYGSGATARSTSMAVRIQVGVNLLGTWTQEIKDGVETSVSENIGHAIDPSGNIETTQQIGTYIRGWAENTAKLTETIGARSNGNNLFGFSKGAIFDGAVPFVQGYGMACVWNNGQAYSRVWNLDFGGKPGYYVVTCEIKAQSEANIRFFLADIPPVDGVGLTNAGNELKVAVTTQWKKITAVYNLTAADIANSNGQLVIRDGSTNNHVFIRKLQIEHGSVPSDFGICKEDEMNISDPVNGITWGKTANSFTEVTTGSNGPGGTSNYITNSYNGSVVHPASNSNIEIASSGISVTNGFYTLSFWAKSNADGNVMHCFCVDATDSTTYDGVMPNYITPYYGDIEPGQQEGMSKWGDVGIKLTAGWRKYYVHYYMIGPSNNMYIVPMRIIGNETGGQTGTYYIAQIKLERGYVTSANRTVYETVMKQTTRRMDFSVLVNSMEKAGIHLYTESNGTPENEAELAKGIIELNADTTRVSNDLVVRRLLTDENKSKPHVEIFGSSALFFGNKGQANIVLSVDEDDCAQLNFFDNDGNFKYGLGPSTIFDNMAVRKDTWSQWFGLSLFSDYGNKYSAVRVHNLAAAQTASYFKFVEGSKQIGGAIIYNHSGNNSPSQYNDKVYSQQTLDTAYFIGIGYYLGEAIPQMSLVDLERGEQLYSRIVYQVEDAAGSAPKMIGAYWYRMTNGNPITARLTDTQGNLLNCSTSDNMSEYIQ